MATKNDMIWYTFHNILCKTNLPKPINCRIIESEIEMNSIKNLQKYINFISCLGRFCNTYLLMMAALSIWKKDRQQKNAIIYENYDGKTSTMMAKICRHVLGLRRQNLIDLLAKLVCVLLLRSKKDV